MVTMSWRMSAIRRGLTPQVFATNSLHLLCTFIEHTETMFIKNNETMFIEHTETMFIKNKETMFIEQTETIDCGLERRRWEHLCIEGPALSGRRGGSHSDRTK